MKHACRDNENDVFFSLNGASSLLKAVIIDAIRDIFFKIINAEYLKSLLSFHCNINEL